VREITDLASNPVSLAGWSGNGPLAVNNLVRLYIYNITNPIEISAGMRPKLEMLGPIEFHEQRTLSNIIFEDNGDIIRFQEDFRLHTKNDSSSKLSLDDQITSIYLPLLLAIYNGFIQSDSVQMDHLFTSRSIGDLVFGYQDELFSFLHSMYPSDVPPDYPGLFHNGSAVLSTTSTGFGNHRMYSGKFTENLGGQLLSFDDMETLFCCIAGPCGKYGPSGVFSRPAWGSDVANSVSGFQSTHRLRPGLQLNDEAEVFNRDMLRRITLRNDGESSEVDGVNTLTFRMDPATLLPASKNPENAPYYQDGDFVGLINGTNCGGAQPLFFSKPLFLDGDPILWKAIAGLPRPDRNLHDSMYSFEPITGVVIEASERTQMNVFLGNKNAIKGAVSKTIPESELVKRREMMKANIDRLPPYIREFVSENNSENLHSDVASGLDAINPVYLPLLWIERHATVSRDMHTFLSERIYQQSKAATRIETFGVIFSGMAAVATILLFIAGRRARVNHRVSMAATELSSRMMYDHAMMEVKVALLSSESSSESMILEPLSISSTNSLHKEHPIVIDVENTSSHEAEPKKQPNVSPAVNSPRLSAFAASAGLPFQQP
jgi:CD36 family